MSEEQDGQITGAAEAAALKSADEYRLERLTWFGLVGALAVTGILPDWLTLHPGLTPLAAGLLLLISGILRYRRGWRVGFSIWAACSLSLALAGFNFLSRPDLDLSLAVVVIAGFIIAAGIFTREEQSLLE